MAQSKTNGTTLVAAGSVAAMIGVVVLFGTPQATAGGCLLAGGFFCAVVGRLIQG